MTSEKTKVKKEVEEIEESKEMCEFVKVLYEDDNVGFIGRYGFSSAIRSCKNCWINKSGGCAIKDKQGKCVHEKQLRNLVLGALRQELEKTGQELRFGGIIIMEQVAKTLIRIARAAEYEAANSPLSRDFDCNLQLHPIVEYSIRLENRLNRLLKELGISPQQLLEYEKIKVTKEIKQQLSMLQNSQETVAVKKATYRAKATQTIKKKSKVKKEPELVVVSAKVKPKVAVP